MSPAQYLAVARDIVILAAIGLLLWWVYRGGENAVKASDLTSLQDEVKRQGKILGDWRKEATDANDKLSQDLAAINAAPAVVHDWMRSPSCPEPAVLPATAATASRSDPGKGNVQPRPGDAATTDRRDFTVAEFKRKWEGILAECRIPLEEWPH